MSKHRLENEPHKKQVEFFRIFLVYFGVGVLSFAILALLIKEKTAPSKKDVADLTSLHAFNIAYDSASHNEQLSWEQLRRVAWHSINYTSPEDFRTNHINRARIDALTDSGPVTTSPAVPNNKRIIIEESADGHGTTMTVGDWQEPPKPRKPGATPDSKSVKFVKSYEQEVYDTLSKLGLYALRASYVYESTVVSLSDSELALLHETNVIPETFTPKVCTYNVTMIGEKGENQRANLSVVIVMQLLGKNAAQHGPSSVDPGMSYTINTDHNGTQAQITDSTFTTIIERKSDGEGTELTPAQIEAYKPLVRECTTWTK